MWKPPKFLSGDDDITLRDYQRGLIEQLLYHLRRVCSEAERVMLERIVMLVSMMGSGKTLMLRYAAEKLTREGLLRGVIVVVPLNSIKEGWTESFSIEGEFEVPPRRWLGDEDLGRARKTDILRAWLSAKNPFPFGLIMTHGAFNAAMKELRKENLPEDFFSGLLLIVDEAHHVAGVWEVEAAPKEERAALLTEDDEDADEAPEVAVEHKRSLHEANVLGRSVEAWLGHGGVLEFATATPIRRAGRLPLPEDFTATVYRSMAQHVAEGMAPSKIDIRSFSFKSGTDWGSFVKTVDGRVLLDADIEASVEQVIRRWEADDQPPSIVLVPQGGSVRWATQFIEELKRRGVPEGAVVNAVGVKSDVVKYLRQVLRDEKRRIRDELPSTVRVIIACRRFDEGTDWPFCAHVYVVGWTRSIVRLLQWLGRCLRRKNDLPGYPKNFIERAGITFFLPQVASDLWGRFFSEHREQALTVAMFMADHKTATAFLGQPYAISQMRGRSVSLDKKAVWAELCDALSMNYEQAWKSVALYKQARILMRCERPSDDAVRDYMRFRMGVADADIDRALQMKEYVKLNRREIIDQVEALVEQGVLGGHPTRRVVDALMKQVFEQAADITVEEDARLMKEASDMTGILSEITGVALHDIRETFEASLRPAPVDPGKPALQLRFEASQRRRKGLLEALVEDILRKKALDPTVRVTVRGLYEERRGQALNLSNAFTGYYGAILTRLVPALAPHIICDGKERWVEDWGAIEVDPMDPKWDAFHERAGGSLPRPDPRGPANRPVDLSGIV